LAFERVSQARLTQRNSGWFYVGNSGDTILDARSCSEFTWRGLQHPCRPSV